MTYDAKTGSNILQWPIEELDSLRTEHTEFDNLKLQPGSIINLNITSAAQVYVLFLTVYLHVRIVKFSSKIYGCKITIPIPLTFDGTIVSNTMLNLVGLILNVNI